jgi:metal-responsive CopG/Arc/MetJ family transcriptional regulator
VPVLKNFNINVESKTIAEIDKLVVERGISRSAWIREAIEEYLLADVGIEQRVEKLEKVVARLSESRRW